MLTLEVTFKDILGGQRGQPSCSFSAEWLALLPPSTQSLAGSSSDGGLQQVWLHVAAGCLPPSATTCHCLPPSGYRLPPSVTVCDYWPPSATIGHHLTASASPCHCLLMGCLPFEEGLHGALCTLGFHLADASFLPCGCRVLEQRFHSGVLSKQVHI